ncbi:MAG: TetR/AcrR family transcriptional regulator [Acidimicrobiales bacterium]|nr:TetR/AcrR family transcriptional regulator [Acidimicrobiales bacterium]
MAPQNVTPTLSRRDEILERAAELFAHKGIAGTTVREIGDAVGMLSGSLYHHFSSKEEIVDAIVSSYLEELQDAYQLVVDEHDDPTERLIALVRASFHSVQARPAACEIYQKELSFLASLPRFAYMTETAEATQRHWMDTIRAGIVDGRIRADVDPAVMYRFLRDAIWMSVRWYHTGGRFSVDELADQFVKIFLEGVLVE